MERARQRCLSRTASSVTERPTCAAPGRFDGPAHGPTRSHGVASRARNVPRTAKGGAALAMPVSDDTGRAHAFRGGRLDPTQPQMRTASWRSEYSSCRPAQIVTRARQLPALVKDRLTRPCHGFPDRWCRGSARGGQAVEAGYRHGRSRRLSKRMELLDPRRAGRQRRGPRPAALGASP